MGRKYHLITYIIFGLCISGAGIVIVIWFFQFNDVSDSNHSISYNYSCEDGTYFTAHFLTSDQLQIIGGDKIMRTAERQSTPPSIETYRSGNYAYTFTEGYEDQIIATTLATDGPRSTICHQSDITSEGKLDPLIHATIQEFVRAADAEKTYQVKTLDNQHFVSHGSATDNGQELTGYFKNGKVYKIVYSLGLSYAVKKYLYYFDDGDLIFVYEEESNYPYVESEGGLDYGNLEFAFGAVYFFEDEKLVMRKFQGERRFVHGEDSMIDMEAKLLAGAEKYLELLSK